MKKKQQQSQKNWPFIVSILIHSLVILSLIFFEDKNQAIVSEEIEIEWVELKEPSKISDLQQAQVVQQEDRLNNVKPIEDYKLSKFNQKVKEETRAIKAGKFKNALNQSVGQKTAKNSPTQQKKTPKKLSLSDLKPDLFMPSFDESKIARNNEGAGSDVSQSDDYLKNVKLGAQTLLSTREFVYYSYYNRIKNKLRQHWEPRIKKKIVKILKRGRSIASAKDKITRLVITLDGRGQLVRVTLMGASGYNDLDDAAIEAFKAAAPFPNPPSGIADKKGEISINWDFVLET